MKLSGITGAFKDMSLSYLLQWIGLSRQSGRLELRYEDIWWQLSVLRGRILEGQRMINSDTIEITRRTTELAQWLRDPLASSEGTFSFQPVEVASGMAGSGVEVPFLLMSLLPEDGAQASDSAASPPEAVPEWKIGLIEAILRQPISPPVLSTTTLHLQQFGHERHASTADLVKLVKADRALSKAVLHCASWTWEGSADSSEALSLAVARLGFKAILSLSYALSLQRPSFATPALTTLQAEIWTNSLGVSMLSRRVAAQVGLDEEQAFVSGLMHDLGKLYLLGVIEDLLLCRTPPRALPMDELRPLLQTLHTRVGRKLPAHWHLPEVVGSTLTFHHEPDLAPPEFRSLVAVVALADSLLGRLRRDENVPGNAALTECAAAAILKLGPRQLEMLTGKTDPLVEKSSLLKVG